MDLVVALLALTCFVALASRRGRGRLARWAVRSTVGSRDALRRRGLIATPPPPPVGRPIQEIAYDARRLALRLRTMPPGASFAKTEGVRRAYDGVLAEGCAALGITHLLGVLPAGPDLDAERLRVEDALRACGVRLERDWGASGIDDVA